MLLTKRHLYHVSEIAQKKICTLVGLKLCFNNLIETQLARVIDVMMARAKRIYILMIKVNNLFVFVFLAVFSKRNRKHVLRVSIE